MQPLLDLLYGQERRWRRIRLALLLLWVLAWAAVIIWRLGPVMDNPAAWSPVEWR